MNSRALATATLPRLAVARAARIPAIALTLTAFALSLSGCAPEVGEAPSKSTQPVASDEPKASDGPITPGTPAASDCNAIVPVDALYNYNPSLSAKPGYTPAPQTLMADIAAAGGTTCAWANETSGDLTEFGMARLAPAEAEQRRSAAARGSRVPIEDAGGAALYFSRANEVGELQGFTQSLWFVARSRTFFSEDDARPLLDAATAAQGGGR